MKIIISPAKNMKSDNDFLKAKKLPAFLEKAEILKKYLKSLSYDELKNLLKCNDKIAKLNYRRYQKMDLYGADSPAILAYDGIQYKYMAPQVFEDSFFEYAEKNVRILSGFYGILNPFDAVVPYRLEMCAKLKNFAADNLYDYWGNNIYKSLIKNDKCILNLASAEYSRTVKKYVTDNISFITCIFGELIDGRIIEKGVYVKMARGEMIRFMAEYNIENIEDIKQFDRLNYKYSEELSSDKKYIFIKEK